MSSKISTLFCFPSAGGSGALFQLWKAALADIDVNVIALDYPGHGRRYSEPLCSSIASICIDLARLISADIYTSPFAFFGHSFGGVVSFELMHYLHQHRLPLPEKLLISAKHAPGYPVHPLLRASQSDESLLNALNALGGLPSAVLQNADLIDLVLPLIRADLTLYENYRYQNNETLSVAITTFFPKKDPIIQSEKMLEWRNFTQADFRQHQLEGDHFYFQKQPAELLTLLKQELIV